MKRHDFISSLRRSIATTSLYLALGFGLIPQVNPCLAKTHETSPSFWISEVFADPSFAPDDQAEFIEICGDPNDLTVGDSVQLSVDGKTWNLGSIALPAGKAWVICRDATAREIWSIPCDWIWPQMSLANGRLLLAGLKQGGTSSFSYEAMIPASKSGESQENRAERGEPADFQPAQSAFQDGHATPGICATSNKTLEMARANKGEAENGDLPSPSNLPAASSLKQPQLSGVLLSLTHPERILLGFPTAYLHGIGRLVTPAGKELARFESPEKSAWVSFEKLLSLPSEMPSDSRSVLPFGPAIVVIEKGSKRWLHALVVGP